MKKIALPVIRLTLPSAALLALASSASAATYTWSGTSITSGSAYNWSNSANWGGSAVTSGTDTVLLFTAGSTGASNYNPNNDLSSPPFQLNKLWLQVTTGTAGPAIVGSQLQFTNNGATAPSIVIDNVAASASISNNILINTNLQVTGTYNGGSATSLNGVISGTGSINLNTTAAPSFVLNGANTFSGGVTVTNGHLVMGVDSVGSPGSITSSPVGTGTLTLNSGTVRTSSAGSRTINNAISIGGNVQLGASSSTTLTLGGATTLIGSGTTRTLTLSANSGTSTAVSFSGAIGDGGNANGITVAGTGVLDLSGTAANTYTGLTTVNSATAILSLNKTAGVNAIAGPLTITSGTVRLAQANQIADSSSITVNGVLDLNGKSETVGSILGGSGTITSGTTGAVTLTVGASASVSFSGSITDGNGTVAVVKQGSDQVVLYGASSFSGGLTLANGSLVLGAANTAGTGTITLNGGTFRSTNGFTTGTLANLVQIGGNVQFGQGSPSYLTLTGAATLTGSAATRTLTAGAASATATAVIFAGPIGDGGNGNGMIVNGSGIVEMSGTAANTYTGVTTVWSPNAILNLNKPAGTNAIAGNLAITTGTVRLAHANQIADSSSVTVNGVLDLNGNSETIGSLLTSSGTITSGSAGAATFTVGGTGSGTFSGQIQNGNGTVSIVKQGSDTLTLSGSNSYSGGTTLSSGTLNYSNVNALGGGALTFSNNSTLQAGVSGTFANAVALNAGATGVFDTQANSDTFSGIISGSGVLTKAGAGTLTLSNSNSYSGGTTISAGTLSCGGNLNALSGGTVTFSGSATLAPAQLPSTSGTLANNVVINSGAMGVINVSSSANITLSGAISGSGALYRVGGATGTDTLILSGSNSYTGGTILAGNGNVDLGADNALGNGTLTIGDANNTGSRFELNSHNQTITNLLFAGNSNKIIQNGGAAASSTGVGILTIGLASGTVTTPSNFYFRDTGGSNTGKLALVKTGAGTLDFSAYSSMFYSGGLTVTGGALAFNNGAALGVGSLTLGGGTLAVTSGSSVTITNATTLMASTTSNIDTGSGTVTHSGVISGSGALTKLGTGTLTLTGTNTFSGDTVVSSGTLALGAAQALAGSTFDTSSLGALSFGSLTAATFGGVKASGNLVLSNTAGAAVALTVGANNQSSSFPGTLSGPGSFLKSGTGTLTLTGSNSYTGATTVSGGTLQLGNGVTDASLVSSSGINDNATLALNLVGNQTYGGAISGTGALIKNGATLTLTGSSAYTGAITVGSGTLQLGDGVGGSIAGGLIIMNAGTTLGVNLPNGGTIGSAIYTYGNAINLLAGGTNTLSGQIYGYATGVINQSGTGTTILTNNNDFGGTTNINAGALQLNGTYAAYNSTVNVNVPNGLAFGVNGASVGALAGSGSFVLLNGTNGVTLTAGGNNANTTYTGTISGTSSTSSFIKSGNGTLILTGSQGYAGSTTVSAGTLQLGDGTSGHDGLLSTSAVTDNGMLVYNLSGSQTAAYSMTGSGGLTKSGSGTLTMANGTLTFAGPLSIASGTLVFSSGSATNLSSTNITIASGATLINNVNNTDNNNNVYAPSNCILTVQNGATLTQDGPTFVAGYLIAPTGATINGNYATVSLLGADSGPLKTAVFGSLSIGRILDGLASSGTQTLQFDGTGTGANIGTVSVRPSATGPTTHNMDIAHSPSAANGVDVMVPTLELRPSAGSLAFNKLGTGVLQINGFAFTGAAPNTNNPVSCEIGAGTMILNASGTNGNGVNFASVTVDNGATLQLGTGGTVGAIYSDVTDNGALIFNRSDVYTYSNVISGSGSVTQSGFGTLTLGGNNTYSGGTTLNAGTLNLGNSNALGSGTAVFRGGATLQAGVTGTMANAITINAGVTGTIDTGTNSVTLSGNITGQGQLVKVGVSGILYLSGSNTYSGGTVIESAAVAGIPGYGALGVVLLSNNALGTGPLSVGDANSGAGARLELNGYNQTVSALTSGSLGTLVIEANGSAGGPVSTLTVNQNINTAYLGFLRDAYSGGGLLALVKSGSGVLDLSGANPAGGYGGGLTVNGGVLGFALAVQVGNGNITLGDGTLRYTPTATSGTLANAISLTATTASVIEVTNAGSALALSGVVSGSGALIKNGSGTLTLSSGDTCNGAITINAGTLQIGNGTDAGSIVNAAAVIDNGALVYNVGTGNRTLGAVISGTGSLKQSSTGTLTLTGSNTYAGGTTINSGTLTIGGAGSLGGGSYAGAIANNGVFNDSSSAAQTLSGVISGSGALAKTGTGTLTLSASNSYTGGTTLSGAGNIELGANSALGNGSLTLGDGNTFNNIRVRLNGYGQTITGLSIGTPFPSVIENQGGGAGVLTVNLASGTNSSASNFILRDSSGGGSGTLALVKSGAGTLDFSTYNATFWGYSGGLTVNGGTLAFNNAAALGGGSIALRGGTLAVTSGSSVTISNIATLAAATASRIDTGTGTVTYSGLLSGSGSLGKAGTGTLTLSGSNSYSGGTTINGGTLNVGADQALGAVAGTVTINDGATLQTSASFALNASRNVSLSGSATIDTQANANTIAGALSASTATLVKQGTGTLTLSNSVTLAGLNANAGTVQLAQAGSIGAINIAAGATVSLTAHGSGAYTALDTSSLTLADSTATLNLWDNAMVVRATTYDANQTTLATIQNLVNAASDGLSWDMAGITSTTAFNETSNTGALAVMVYDNGAITLSDFEGIHNLGHLDGDGNPVDYNQVLLKLTYIGDFTADGFIDSSDYALLDSYAQSGSLLGDLSGDGIVDSSDYALLDTGFQNQGYGVLAGSGGGAVAQTAVARSSAALVSPEAVPEPGTLGLLLTAAMGLLGRRSRREHSQGN